MAFQFAVIVLLLTIAKIGTRCEANVINTSGRIINGNTVNNNAFPWHADIQSSGSEVENRLCAGSLIWPEWILTAARCVRNFDNFTITLGTIDRDNAQIVIFSNESIVHPNYKGGLANDIALIRLPDPVEFTEIVWPVTLPDRSHEIITFVGCKSRITGFKTSTTRWKSRADPLYWVELSIIANTKCSQYLGSQITDTVICADALKEGNITEDDYGAALVISEEDSWIQIGIASYVQPGSSGKMSAFTRVPAYLQWINKSIEDYEYY